MSHVAFWATPADAPAGSAPVGSHKPCVLVVDDEPAFLNTLAGLVRRAGFEVLTAHDAQEAWTCFEREGSRLCALLTDLVMPGELDGIGLAAKVREARPTLPVILVTGWPETVSAGARTAYGVLGKPFTAQRLASALSKVFTAGP
ncbi:MAG TPA: response regulator [Chthoniobacterales bacterium]